ncbi:peptidase inhibitor family I36 protein [Streptomyces sp. CA-250714]|uniref:peptidase inhibitor family I36 protein n=1 Tax=Streptomyces sp. CA-250714 TaxID=3240060 RepID=UPI003D90715E
MASRYQAAGRFAAAVCAVGALAFTALPASAQPQGAQAASADSHGALASYKGKKIDLSEGWQGAQACAVFSPDDIRCYSTHEAAEKATGYNRATDPLARKAANGSDVNVTASLPCANDWLCLYQFEDGEGRRLLFSDNYWMNLDQYDFDNRTSSWRNNQGDHDWAYLARYKDGGGWNLTLHPESQSSAMGNDYDNKASSVQG